MDKEFISRIKEINWFANCGKAPRTKISFEYIRVGNWKAALEQSEGKYWELITQEADNQLSEYLLINHPNRYKEWNKYAQKGREVIDNFVVPNVTNYLIDNNLPYSLLDNVRWEFIGAIMENNYRNERQPAFFMELFKVYESGNFPCGWEGRWPKGKLIVY
ncbi:hypothetical protein [Paenibacillus fonticola]|uniref:hypothetical protein n=1 Tax=Paenibacillus fonticola TaxID=379896 RepID=UPI000375939B|nr:hypothetical protein [Paenibacillus fonticola]